jgi:ElaB/YqjD/DUF883 family membrane-anchored ribosome-binding protein
MKSPAHETDTVADLAGERAKHYVDSGVDACNAVSAKTRAAARQVDGYVRDNPWLMIGAAAGVGVLVGMMLRRR